jgi:hypothetical protein
MTTPNAPSRTVRHIAERIEVGGRLVGSIRVSLNERSPLTAQQARDLTRALAGQVGRIIEGRMDDG